MQKSISIDAKQCILMISVVLIENERTAHTTDAVPYMAEIQSERPPSKRRSVCYFLSPPYTIFFLRLDF